MAEIDEAAATRLAEFWSAEIADLIDTHGLELAS